MHVEYSVEVVSVMDPQQLSHSRLQPHTPPTFSTHDQHSKEHIREGLCHTLQQGLHAVLLPQPGQQLQTGILLDQSQLNTVVPVPS